MIKEKTLVLPKPSGSFQVGRAHFHFIDDTRFEPSAKAGTQKRDIPVLIWYPIDDPGSKAPLHLLKEKDLTNLKQAPLFAGIPNEVCTVVTNSYENNPISSKMQTFPILIFNHGFTLFMEQSTILMEHLVSNGYIVVSIGHPYEGIASYPDGRSLPYDRPFYKDSFAHIFSEESEKKQKEIFDQLRRNDISIELMKSLTEKAILLWTFPSQPLERWVDDTLFISEILFKLNTGEISSQFKNKFSLKEGMGLFGHSGGGCTSVLTCGLDDRFTCAINIDGIMVNGLDKRYSYKKPLMFMYSEYNTHMNKYFHTINENDSYTIIIKDTSHMDFMDFSYIQKTLLGQTSALYGKIDATQMVTITNDYVLSFFNKYIKGTSEKTLESNPYEIVSFEKH